MSIPPEAAELANEANSVFVDEDYDTALDLYTQVRRKRAVSRASPPGVRGRAGGCTRRAMVSDFE